jgi:arabinogalactan endo-1,4-beta-galactosidase
VSVQGQASAIRDIINAVAGLGDVGLGVIYWEPAWIPVEIYNGDDEVLKRNQQKWEEFGSGWASSFASGYDTKDAGMWYGGSSWENQAMFDYEGNPLPSLNVWKYVNYGAVAPLGVERVEDTEAKANPGEDVVLPETVEVLYNNGNMDEVAVTWDAAQLALAVETGRGEYIISGTVDVAGQIFSAKCLLEINVMNYVPDPSFEERTAAWTISDTATAGIRHEPNNARTGEYCLHFYSADAVNITAELVISGLDSGYYNFSAHLQGGDAGEDAEFLIYAYTTGSDLRYEQTANVTKWQEWQKPEISGIFLPDDDGSIYIGVSVRCAAGGWGSFDDLYLYKAD